MDEKKYMCLICGWSGEKDKMKLDEKEEDYLLWECPQCGYWIPEYIGDE